MKWTTNKSVRNSIIALAWTLGFLIFAFVVGHVIKALGGGGFSEMLALQTEEVDSVWDGRAISIDYDDSDIRPLFFDLDDDDTARFNLGSFSYYPVYVSCSNPIDSVIIFVNSDSVLAFQFHDIDSLKVYSDFSGAVPNGFESENKAFVVIKHEEVIINE